MASTVNISKLNIIITANAKQLRSAVDESNSALSRFRKGVDFLTPKLTGLTGTLTRVFAAFVAFRTVSFGFEQLFDSVKLAADAEQAQISLKVLLGSAEDASKTLEGLYDFVESTPFRLTELQDSTRKLAAFGFEAREILPTLRSLGDLASATGNPIQELADLVGRARAENRQYTKDLNQFTSRGIPILQELASVHGVALEGVRALAADGRIYYDDIIEAIARMTSEGGRFYNLMQEQSQTLAGEWSNFLDEVDALKREFGRGLLPILKEVTSALRVFVSGVDGSTGSMSDAEAAGRSFGETLRWIAQLVPGMALAVNRAMKSVIYPLKLADDAVNLFTGSQLKTFNAMIDGLDEAAKKYESQIYLMSKAASENENLQMNINRAAAAARRAAEEHENLGDIVGLLPREVRRAQNELKAMSEDGAAAAEKLIEKYATPLEEFKSLADYLVNAQVFGNLSDDLAKRILKAEIEKLRLAADEIRKAKNEGIGALRKGSQEEIAARFKYRPVSPNINNDVRAAGDFVRNRLQEAERLKAELTFKAAQVTKESVEIASNTVAKVSADARAAAQELGSIGSQKNSPYIRTSDKPPSISRPSSPYQDTAFTAKFMQDFLQSQSVTNQELKGIKSSIDYGNSRPGLELREVKL